MVLRELILTINTWTLKDLTSFAGGPQPIALDLHDLSIQVHPLFGGPCYLSFPTGLAVHAFARLIARHAPVDGRRQSFNAYLGS